MLVDLVPAEAKRDEHDQRDEHGYRRGQRPPHAAPRPAAPAAADVLPLAEPGDQPVPGRRVSPLARLVCPVFPRSPVCRPRLRSRGLDVVPAPPAPGCRTGIPGAGVRPGPLLIHAAVARTSGHALRPAGLRRWLPPERAAVRAAVRISRAVVVLPAIPGRLAVAILTPSAVISGGVAAARAVGIRPGAVVRRAIALPGGVAVPRRVPAGRLRAGSPVAGIRLGQGVTTRERVAAGELIAPRERASFGDRVTPG